LFGQSSEILLPGLKGSSLFACCPLKIHGKPERPYKETGDSCSDVLADLRSFVRSEFLYFLVIGLDLGYDC
jgi:hypothetical protein